MPLSCTPPRVPADHQGSRDHATSRELTGRTADEYQSPAHSLGTHGTGQTEHYDLPADYPARGPRQRARRDGLPRLR